MVSSFEYAQMPVGNITKHCRCQDRLTVHILVHNVLPVSENVAHVDEGDAHILAVGILVVLWWLAHQREANPGGKHGDTSFINHTKRKRFE